MAVSMQLALYFLLFAVPHRPSFGFYTTLVGPSCHFTSCHIHQLSFSPVANFRQLPLSSVATFTSCHFHQLPLSPVATYTSCHFHQLPLSPIATLTYCHFHQLSLSPVITFNSCHFHQSLCMCRKLHTNVCKQKCSCPLLCLD